MTMRNGTVEVAGVRSPYVEAGPHTSEEAIVFVHGNPGMSTDWTDMMLEVEHLARTVAPDMPGFGRASKPRDFDYTVEGYARHLGGFLDQIGVRRAHLVLHDFGGAWGLAWAAANPNAFASVTLINIGVPLGYRWHSMARIWQTPVLGELAMALTNRPGFRLALKRVNPRGLPDTFVDQMYRHFDLGTRRAVLKLYRSARDIDSQGRRLAATLRPLDRPALVIWGKQDPFVPVELADRQREVFPKAEITVLDDSGHWPFVDNHKGVAGTLVPFLRDAVGR